MKKLMRYTYEKSLAGNLVPGILLAMLFAITSFSVVLIVDNIPKVNKMISVIVFSISAIPFFLIAASLVSGNMKRIRRRYQVDRSVNMKKSEEDRKAK